MEPMPKWKRFLIGAALFAGLILTILSLINACTEACVESHSYSFLGMPFEWTGLAFFAILIPSFLLSNTRPRLSLLTSLMLASGIGAELMFILIQKYTIGAWCPVCLGIAASLGIATAIWASNAISTIKELSQTCRRGDLMSYMKRILGSFSALVVGFTVAFVGIAKKDDLHASQTTLEQHIAFGKTNSPIEIYIFTSWVCPACRHFEPALESMSPGLMKNAKVIFVDYGVDDITLNFLPYNLSFMFYNKDDYLTMRGALKELSDKTNEPDDKAVKAAVSKLGLKYKEVNYANVAAAIEYFKEKATNLKIKSLPSLVIINNDTKKTATLVGKEINPTAIQNTMNKIGKQG